MPWTGHTRCWARHQALGLGLGELWDPVQLKNPLQRMIPSFQVHKKPARTIYEHRGPSARGRGRSRKQIPGAFHAPFLMVGVALELHILLSDLLGFLGIHSSQH